jgi:tRNA(Arg) A34 adenosine deaminase TadA
MSESHEQNQFMMKRACELSSTSVSKGCGPFGCVITDQDGLIIAEGYNQVTQTNDPTAHAEIVAIREACKCLHTYQLTNCKLYSSCEPCPMCLSAIYWARIPHVYYGNTRKDAKDIGFDDDYIYEELKKNMEQRNIKIERIDTTNSYEGFDLWVNKKDKLFY